MAFNTHLIGWMVFILLLATFLPATASKAKGRTRPHTLPSKKIQEIALQSKSTTSISRLLNDIKQISVVRVPDTPQHKTVQDYIKSSFGDIWEIEEDSFTSETPFGPKKFTNIIVQLKSDAKLQRQQTKKSKKFPNSIVLAAHYDSKYFENMKFVGTIDSAVSCGLIIELAKFIELQDPQILTTNVDKRPLLKLVFFDGEEAFVDWTATDSIYGSKHLAQKWSEERMPAFNNMTQLDNIEFLMLLDLIGSSNQRFYSYHEDTTWLFDRLVTIEEKLKDGNLIDSQETFFQKRRLYNLNLEDDHIPFLKRSVPCLHLIPLPFPPVWHKEEDDFQHIDREAIIRWNMVLQAFFAEILHL